MTEFRLWECLVCGLIYDEALGWPDDNIAPGTRWGDVPEDWLCPDCGVGKEDFQMVDQGPSSHPAPTPVPANTPVVNPSANRNTHSTTSPTLLPELAPLVIIGTGLAGYTLAKAWRKLNPTAPLTLISADAGNFYSKPLLSTAFQKKYTPQTLATASAEQMAETLSATVITHTRVIKIDPSTKHIHTEDGHIRYANLVLALGADTIALPLQGNAIDQVYSVNDLEDFGHFQTATHNKKKILILGAGLIGSEYANDLIQSGFEVDVVDPQPHVLASLLPQALASRLQTTLANAGVRYHLGCVVTQVAQTAAGIRATLSNGEALSADLVLSAVGVRPRTQLAQSANIACNKGIMVDATLATNHAHIYALGDCAEVEGAVRFYVQPLSLCAQALAKTLSGQTTAVAYPAMAVTIKTTLCPVVVCPPAAEAQGQWQLASENAQGMKALFITNQCVKVGFALLGSAINETSALLRDLNSSNSPNAGR